MTHHQSNEQSVTAAEWSAAWRIVGDTPDGAIYLSGPRELSAMVSFERRTSTISVVFDHEIAAHAIAESHRFVASAFDFQGDMIREGTNPELDVAMSAVFTARLAGASAHAFVMSYFDVESL